MNGKREVGVRAEEQDLEAKTRTELIRWIEAELLTADGEKRTYLEEIGRWLRTSTDRRSHMSWGDGDIDFSVPSAD